jgi:hypothetical protein
LKCSATAGQVNKKFLAPSCLQTPYRDSMFKLYDASNLPEAHLLLDLLRQAGIAAQVLNSYAQGATGEIPFGQAYPEIWLEDENDGLRAQAIINEYETTPMNPDWIFCRQCGERNPANFELCWQCGNELIRENN